MCVCYCTELSHATQQRTVLNIFPPNLQTIIVAQMLSIGEEAERKKELKTWDAHGRHCWTWMMLQNT